MVSFIANPRPRAACSGQVSLVILCDKALPFLKCPGRVFVSCSGVTEPRGCPVARNPALHLLGSLYSLPAAFLRSKISIGLVHSFRHSQSTALPGQALQRRPSGQHLTLEGSQSTRKGWGGLLSGEPGGGGGGKGNTAPAPPAGLREGPLGHRHAPVSYTHLTLPTMLAQCRSRWSPYH